MPQRARAWSHLLGPTTATFIRQHQSAIIYRVLVHHIIDRTDKVRFVNMISPNSVILDYNIISRIKTKAFSFRDSYQDDL